MTFQGIHVPLAVEKPARYTGGEVNAVHKDRRSCRLGVALAFPDIYEVGMSHLGLQILYALLNDLTDVCAERVYAPWPDMEDHLRRHGLPLVSLESGIPLREFDIVGFSLQYELSYTNVLTMLELGGIPLQSRDRRDTDPIVIAGGPCAFNPLPMSPFIDAFVIGEGEEVIGEIARSVLMGKQRGRNREGILHDLSAREGIYVPSLHRGDQRIHRRVVADLNAWRTPLCPVVPLVKTIHDRVTLEIARGCSRGCRFCQAGMVWRPVRERDPSVLEEMAAAMVAATGHDEISLLSLSSGDYSGIEGLMSSLMERYYPRRIALALPSLRVETLTGPMIENIKKVRKTSFTLAPEAGTERLRRVINKGNTEAELLATLERVYDAGWRAVKLYFMIGLPTEGDGDMEGIADLALKSLAAAKGRGDVTVNLSTFVPKPHTPFQWERQIGTDEAQRRQDFFKKILRHRRINIKWHAPEMSLLEGVFARGDERLGTVIERAYRAGCRFDGWGEQLRFDHWQEAMKAAGIAPLTYLEARSLHMQLPWEFIDAGVRREFLREEAQRASLGSATPDCRYGPCSACGACDFQKVEPRIAAMPGGRISYRETPGRTEKKRYLALRICFRKTGPSRYLSHLDCATALFRAFCRAGITFRFTEGFHPHPKISFATATALGLESEGEYADMQIEDPEAPPALIIDRVNAGLPAGMMITELVPLGEGSVPLGEALMGFVYNVSLPDDTTDRCWEEIKRRSEGFMAAAHFIITRENKGVRKETDIRPLVKNLTVDDHQRLVLIETSFSPRGTVRPHDVLTQVLGIGDDQLARVKIVKKRTLFQENVLTKASPLS
ncbi:MAG: TIGR03960 family B12-binding radical SAM protein [Syntrophales bacterium]|nr:TIGR03960 family B12-binding radical SAM protein [Syntrophales bacterium]